MPLDGPSQIWRGQRWYVTFSLSPAATTRKKLDGSHKPLDHPPHGCAQRLQDIGGQASEAEPHDHQCSVSHTRPPLAKQVKANTVKEVARPSSFVVHPAFVVRCAEPTKVALRRILVKFEPAKLHHSKLRLPAPAVPSLPFAD